MTTIKDIKRHADSIRKCMTGEHYYDKNYKDLSVADLLLVLEDENWHTEETLLEALAHMKKGQNGLKDQKKAQTKQTHLRMMYGTKNG